MPNELISYSGILEQNTYFGPAKIVAFQNKLVQLECPDCYPWARVAVSHGYQPVIGDLVLAAGRTDEWYVIGVLEGSGTTTLTVPGNLSLRAPCGTVEVIGGEGIHLKSPNVAVTAGSYELTAQSVFRRIGEATEWIAKVLRRRIGRMDTRVEGDCSTHADRIVNRAEGDVIVNGRTINLN